MTILIIALLIAVLGCSIWLVREDRRDAAAARLERQLKASRYRSDDT